MQISGAVKASGENSERETVALPFLTEDLHLNLLDRISDALSPVRYPIREIALARRETVVVVAPAGALEFIAGAISDRKIFTAERNYRKERGPRSK